MPDDIVMRPFYWIFIASVFMTACQQQVVIDDIENIPITSSADSVFSNVYKSLDGTWTGEFEIFRDDDRGRGWALGFEQGYRA